MRSVLRTGFVLEFASSSEIEIVLMCLTLILSLVGKMCKSWSLRTSLSMNENAMLIALLWMRQRRSQTVFGT